MTADRQVRSARILALLFCVAGAVAIAVGWNGAASQASADSQLPYLLSGGAAGIGLLTFGVGLLLIAQIRAERQRVSGVLDLMGASVAARARDQLAADRAESAEEDFGLPVKGARVLALVLAFVGFAMIVLGWNGMAKASSADEQLPYLLSGGFGGMALIVLSVALLLVAQIRTERRKLMDVLEVMAVAVGSTAPAKADVPTEPGNPVAPGLLVAGPSTYHRPECRLVQGKSGLDRLSAEAAKSSGLASCRVCDPDGVASNGSASTNGSGEKAETDEVAAEQAADVGTA